MASRILLADESITVQKLVNLAFADEGIEVVAVSRGELAKRLLGEINLDLVLASSTLPGINGYELCRYIKKSAQFGDLPVILLSNAFEPFTEAEARRCGADAQLTKPAESARLVEVARKLIDGRNESRAGGTPPPDKASVPADDVNLAGASSPEKGPQEKAARQEPAEDAPGRPAAAPKSGSFFKPYMPALPERRDASEARQHNLQPPSLPAQPEAPPQPPPDSAILVVWVAACVMLLVISMVVWQVMHFNARNSDDAESSAQQAPPVVAPGDEPRPPATAPGESGDDQAARSDQAASTPNEEGGSPAAGEAAGGTADEGERDGASELIQPEPEADALAYTAPLASRRAFRAGSLNRAGAHSLVATRSQMLASRALIRDRMLSRARQLQDKGLLAQAEQQYVALVASFPQDSMSRYELGRVRASLATRRNEERSFANRVSGLKAFVAGNYGVAAAELNAAVKAGRADTAVLYSLGTASLKLGRLADARSAFERCLAASPDYAPAMVGLAQVKVASGNNDQAVLLLKRALELGGGAEFTPERIREMISRYSTRPRPLPQRP